MLKLVKFDTRANHPWYVNPKYVVSIYTDEHNPAHTCVETVVNTEPMYIVRVAHSIDDVYARLTADA